MDKTLKMSSLSEKNEYERVKNEYDNLFGVDIGSRAVSSQTTENKPKSAINFVNGELIIKKR